MALGRRVGVDVREMALGGDRDFPLASPSQLGSVRRAAHSLPWGLALVSQ